MNSTFPLLRRLFKKQSLMGAWYLARGSRRKNNEDHGGTSPQIGYVTSPPPAPTPLPPNFFCIPFAHVAHIPDHALDRGWEASLSSNHACLERQISKTRRFTNVVCCKMKIVRLELFPGSSAIPKFLGANTGGYIVRSFFRLSFSVSHALAWPLELEIQTHNPHAFTRCFNVVLHNYCALLCA